MTAPRPLLLDNDGQPYRRNDGRLVYLVQGGSSPAAPATSVPAATPPATGQTDAPAAPATAPSVIPPGATVVGQAPAAPPAPGDGLPDSADELKAIIARLNREAAGHRVAKNEIEQQTAAAIAKAVEQAQAEQAQSIGKALGLIKDEGQQVTPDQLTAQFAEKEAGLLKQIRDLTVNNALSGALAGTHPGARDALIGSGKLADLDPTADDFAAKLQAVVTEYLDANPYFRVTTPVVPQAGSSGGDFSGRSGANPDLDNQIAEALKAGDIQRSIALKRAKAQRLAH